MKAPDKTRPARVADDPIAEKQLINELARMRQRVAELEAVEAECKQAEELLQRRNQELALLDQASRAFSSTLDLDRVLAIVLEEVRRLLGVTACSIWLVDTDTDELICRQATGPKSESVRDWHLKKGEGLAGWVVQHGKSLNVPDVQADERHFKGIDPEDNLGLRSILSIPLLVKQDVIGVLQVVDAQVGSFDTQDLPLLESLAASAAIAIENARLYEQARREIVERKRAEQTRVRLLAQIQRQAQQMQQVMNTVPAGVLLLDSVGQVALVNPLGEEYLATLADAKPGDVLVHLGNRPLQELLTSPPKGLWHDVEVDGSPRRLFEVIARPMEDGPETEGWVLAIRDVTKEKEIERRAQQQERLATVGQLAAGIAHDFNNIMASIVLYAQILSQVPDRPPREQEQLAAIKQQAMHATELIQQILDFGRRSALERRPMDLLVFLKEQIKLLERTLPEDIEIDLAYDRKGYTINADPTRIQQVFMNLAINARDAMPEGGALRIGLEQVRVEDRGEVPLLEMEIGDWVRVTVSDTGTGISPDVLPYIFDPFFTTKSDGKGTGLGLAQVWGIVSQHQGHVVVNTQVQADSGQPTGTTFVIYLPVLHTSCPETLVQEEASTLTRGQGETILVVEDNTTVRQAVMGGLESLDYQTLAAANGREALDVFERYAEEIALIVSDTVMPEMGGMALLHALREEGYEGQFIVMTGHLVHDGDDHLRSLDIAAQLQKPISLEKLAQVTARALKNRRSRSER